MLLANDFVWMHIPKTGGTWLREVLRAHAPKAWGLQVIYPGHHTGQDLSSTFPQYASKRRFAFVRNPWDWHVSRIFFWHQHYWNRTGGYAAPAYQWDATSLRWAERLESVGRIREPEQFRRLLGILLTQAGIPTQSAWLEQMREGADVFEVGRFERLREEGVRLLRLSAADPLARRLREEPPQMVSAHANYQTYYDAASRELVAEREQILLAETDYRFEG
jgi:hypothetical protein